MSANGVETLSARQEKALAALIANPTLETAAQASKVSPRTLQRWIREDPLFQAEYREARRAALDAAIAALQTSATEAIETLRRNLSNRNAHAQIRAATTILDYAFKGSERFDLEHRIAELERNAVDSQF